MRSILGSVSVASLFLGALAATILVGCLGQSGGASAQTAATNFTNNVRFGRMELAAEQVAPGEKNQSAFVEHHSAWGNRIRVADAELVGIKMVKKDEEADVSVKVSWFRLDEEELRLTTIKQKWTAKYGGWLLASETRVDGDIGLLGEKVEQAEDAPPRDNVHFPTIHIGQN